MKRQYGFTLMELLVVIAILGILIVAGLTTFTSAQKKSRDTKRKNDLRQISLSLESYYNDFNMYPLSDSDGKILGCDSGGSASCTWGGVWKNTSTTPETLYMLTLPSDQKIGRVYFYRTNATGSYYQLYALLENQQDEGAGVDQSGYAGTDCGDTLLCTYGISSTDRTP
jgi:prepilin-type N-terminal cleavage/methylation domain-containing protein